MEHNLFYNVTPMLLTSGIAVSDTSTDWDSGFLDMKDYQGVAFLAVIDSTSTGGSLNLHVEMCATSSVGGTGIDVDASAAYHSTGFSTGQGSAVLITDVFKPQYRWVRPYVDRVTTGESIVNLMALFYRPSAAPTTWSTGQSICDVTIVVGTSGTATG